MIGQAVFCAVILAKEYTALVNDSNLLSVVILCKSSKKELIGTIDSVLAQEGVRIELVIGSNGCWLDMQEELLINHINARCV